jgi:hypothetical protein
MRLHPKTRALLMAAKKREEALFQKVSDAEFDAADKEFQKASREWEDACYPNTSEVYEVPGIGELNFQALDHCLGHGDPHLSHNWVMALTVHRGIDAPKGFKFIVDAELTPVALVPDKMVEPFLNLLNGRDS